MNYPFPSALEGYSYNKKIKSLSLIAEKLLKVRNGRLKGTEWLHVFNKYTGLALE